MVGGDGGGWMMGKYVILMVSFVVLLVRDCLAKNGYLDLGGWTVGMVRGVGWVMSIMIFYLEYEYCLYPR